MLRDLLRPKLLVSHVLVLTAAVVCVLLGNWQLSRLAEVRENNDRLTAQMEAEPIDLVDLLDGPVDQAELEFRPVTVSGTFRADEEVLQRNRSYQGQQGFHLLTPLEVTDGKVVLVRRGWVPAIMDQPPVPEALPPSGTVQISGILERSVEQPDVGARDPDEGILERVFHPDIQRLARQIDGELFPMVLRLETQEPPLNDGPGQVPFLIPSPELDEANHLSYALQWYSFALLAVVTYGAWLWNRRKRRSLEDEPGDDADDRQNGHGPGAGEASLTLDPDHPAKGSHTAR